MVKVVRVYVECSRRAKVTKPVYPVRVMVWLWSYVNPDGTETRYCTSQEKLDTEIGIL